jgi:hypothetical protein
MARWRASDGYKASYLKARDASANAAKAYAWTAPFRLLESDPTLVNGWRLGGTSPYGPLLPAYASGGPMPRAACHTARTATTSVSSS